MPAGFAVFLALLGAPHHSLSALGQGVAWQSSNIAIRSVTGQPESLARRQERHEKGARGCLVVLGEAQILVHNNSALEMPWQIELAYCPEAHSVRSEWQVWRQMPHVVLAGVV
ncbi:TPA: hypothetical protein I7145_23825, partial [Vibrio vulnificus]|nr:hypothetical protein [Vibrio vulnificus]